MRRNDEESITRYKIKLIDLFTPIKLMPLKVRNMDQRNGGIKLTI